MKLLQKHVAIVFLLTIVVVGFCSAVKKVEVKKCCHVEEVWDLQTQACKVESYTGSWHPKVYMAKKNSFAETLLSHMTPIQNEKPSMCSEPKVFHNLDRLSMSLLPNGSLYIIHLHKIFDPLDFCVDRGLALVCTDDAKAKKEFVHKLKTEPMRKCCAPTEVYLSENKTCTAVADVKPMPLDEELFDVIYSFPDCEKPVYAIIGKYSPSNIDNTSTLTYAIGADNTLKATQFCVETVLQNGRPEKIDVFTCEEHVPESQVPPGTTDSRIIIYSVILFISVIFLFATLIVGLLTPSNHHVMHWKCQTYYIVCLLVGELLLATTNIFSSHLTGAFCSGIAIIMHFSFLAAFFWLNTMCFNIWWTFRDFRPSSMERRQEICRLHLYEIWAWGFPLIIAGIAAILDYGGGDNVLRPRFGEKTCWFYGDKEIFAFFFLPIGILLIVNIFLFAMTTRQLTCGLWKREEVKSTTERATLGRVCIKLVVVMGVTWVADVLSWAIGGPDAFWYITDIINALQGVFIFGVVASQPQVQVAIRRLCCARSHKAATNTTAGPQHSSSSHGLPSVGEGSTQNTTSSKIPNETAC